MSGMAGNVTAFNTVWTYDIYKAYINPDAPDRHYLNMGRIARVAGAALSIVTAYLVLGFANIIDYVQLLHGIFLVPLSGTFLLGMFWRRTTGWGGFTGLFTGTATGVILYPISLDSSVGASMYRALWAFFACLAVTILVSLFTRPKPESELRSIVWGLTPKKPWVLAAIVLALNIYFSRRYAWSRNRPGSIRKAPTTLWP